jgi:hypothetical protein
MHTGNIMCPLNISLKIRLKRANNALSHNIISFSLVQNALSDLKS